MDILEQFIKGHGVVHTDLQKVFHSLMQVSPLRAIQPNGFRLKEFPQLAQTVKRTADIKRDLKGLGKRMRPAIFPHNPEDNSLLWMSIEVEEPAGILLHGWSPGGGSNSLSLPSSCSIR